jgi:hypothetical protein
VRREQKELHGESDDEREYREISTTTDNLTVAQQ